MVEAKGQQPAASTIGLLALTAIADDPRVRRQGDAFAAAGWTVAGIGLEGAVSPPPSWEAIAVPLPQPPAPTWLDRVLRIARRSGSAATPALAERQFWTLHPAALRLYERARTCRVDLWLANDWMTLPVVRRLAREQGVPFVYDTHELASEEYAQRPLWRFTHRPFVKAIEAEGLREAALVTCVSDGIADRLRDTYRLARRPTVIRNLPAYREVAFRPTGETIEVLYHGVVSPGRGLPECIRSVADWRPEFRLSIRGPASEEYRSILRQAIEAAQVEGRVALLPPVPMTDLVGAASAFDVGLFALPDDSWHNRYALPNKIFEYAMAGLGLCVSDLPEMAAYVRKYDLGLLIPAPTAPSIAATINALDRPAIDRYKRNALAAARDLNWEREGRILVELCEALIAA